MQHNGKYPSQIAVLVRCTVGAAGSGAINTEKAMIDQSTNSVVLLTQLVAVQTRPTLGPYIRQGIPSDPFSDPAVSAIVVATGGIRLPLVRLRRLQRQVGEIRQQDRPDRDEQRR